MLGRVAHASFVQHSPFLKRRWKERAHHSPKSRTSQPRLLPPSFRQCAKGLWISKVARPAFHGICDGKTNIGSRLPAQETVHRRGSLPRAVLQACWKDSFSEFSFCCYMASRPYGRSADAGGPEADEHSLLGSKAKRKLPLKNCTGGLGTAVREDGVSKCSGSAPP